MLRRTAPREMRTMKRSRYSDEQIAYPLRQAESGTAVADVGRQLGISEATFSVAASVRISAHSCFASLRGLVDQHEARAASVAPLRAAATPSRASSQGRQSASRCAAGPE